MYLLLKVHYLSLLAVLTIDKLSKLSFLLHSATVVTL